MPQRPEERMPNVPSEDRPPPPLQVPGVAPDPFNEQDQSSDAADFVTKLQQKMKSKQDKIRNVKGNLNNPPLTKWLGEEDLTQQTLGTGPNKIMVGKKGMEVVLNQNSANPKPLKMTDDENVLSPATGDMSVKADMGKIDFNNKVLNKRFESGQPTNVYNHYPPVLTRPPSLLQSKVRNILKVVVITARILEAADSGTRSQRS